jgi:hypothetical protein
VADEVGLKTTGRSHGDIGAVGVDQTKDKKIVGIHVPSLVQHA